MPAAVPVAAPVAAPVPAHAAVPAAAPTAAAAFLFLSRVFRFDAESSRTTRPLMKFGNWAKFEPFPNFMRGTFGILAEPHPA